MDDFRRRFAALLRQKRIDAELTQEDLADRIGVRQPAISAWEAGRALPEIPTLLATCEVVGIDAGDLAQLRDEVPA